MQFDVKDFVITDAEPTELQKYYDRIRAEDSEEPDAFDEDGVVVLPDMRDEDAIDRAMEAKYGI